VDREKKHAIIAHEAIPGYMEAMAMEFNVPGAADLAILQPGATVSFHLSVDSARSWIDHVQLISAAVAVPGPPSPVELGMAISPGSLAPDCALVDQKGRAIRLSDFHGRALAITFIFTRCPLPDFCPRMNENLSAVQDALPPDNPGWHLLSLSMDPAFDTPAQLTSYAARFQPKPERWSFATGDPADIEKLAGSFGLRIFREGTELNHTLRTVVIDPTGRVQKVFTGNEWKPADLVDEMQHLLPPKP
jgi:protein SCO1/2